MSLTMVTARFYPIQGDPAAYRGAGFPAHFQIGSLRPALAPAQPP
jgi:hypothetical protein